MKEKIKVKGQLGLYLQWLVTLPVLFTIMNLITDAMNLTMGLMMCGLTLTYIVIVLQTYVYKCRCLMAGLVKFSAEYTWVQKKLLADLGPPYMAVDEMGCILRMNREFLRISKEEKGSGRNLISFSLEVTKETLAELKETISVYCGYGENRYRIDLKPVLMEEDGAEVTGALGSEAGGQRLIAIYSSDETEVLKYRQEIDDQETVAGLIYLDNYEEALGSVEGVRRSPLMALIDHKISRCIAGMDGMVKKLEKDKCFFTVKQQYAQELQNSRLSILEEVKMVNIGNEMVTTLSTGMGINGETYSQNCDFAHTAIDTALGRGGDQTVVKDVEKVRCYGSKSQQLEKTTRMKARMGTRALQELMETKDRLLVTGHKLPDINFFDAVVGIYRIATPLNEKTNIVINEVTSPVWPMMERFMDNPDYPEGLFLTGDQTAERVGANVILAMVDMNRSSVTGTSVPLRMVKTIVVLGHHGQSSETVDSVILSYMEPYASSACEMVAEVLQYIADGIKIKPSEADAAHVGVIINTNSFTDQTGVRTFEAVVYLGRSGADITRVRKLFRDDMNDYKAKAGAMRMAEAFEGVSATSMCPTEGVESLIIVAAQAANGPLGVNETKAPVMLSQYNGTIYLGARPTDEVSVQVVIEKLGGGSHRTIAGAQLPDITIKEAIERSKTVIIEIFEKGDTP